MCKFRLVVMLALLALGLGRTTVSQAAPPPHNPYSPTQFGLPETVAGYQVLAVLTEDNFVCMAAGEKRLILQSPELTAQDSLRAFNVRAFKAEMEKLGLGEYTKWGWQIVGPGETRDKLIRQVTQSYQFFKTNGCLLLGGPQGKGVDPASPLGGEIKVHPPAQGFAVIQDTDVGKFSNVNAQSVFLIAPTVGDHQLDYSAFLNNVMTNVGDYFLQDGLAFYNNGTGATIWTDSTHKLIGQPFNITYVANNAYWATITFTNGSWWMCLQGPTYVCQAQPKGTGTHPKQDLNTSVFFENWNRNLNWVKGFSPRFYAFGAKIYRNGLPQNWKTQAMWTEDACHNNWSPSGAISGGLVSGKQASFKKFGIPPYC
jgi:hypothetical protein